MFLGSAATQLSGHYPDKCGISNLVDISVIRTLSGHYPDSYAQQYSYIVTNLKTTRDARVGDTVTLKKYFDKDKG